jgi:hypothetical protein
MVGNGPEDGSGEAKPALVTPEILEAYFKSIEGPFGVTRTEMTQEEGPLKTLAGVLFGFSLFPLVPYILSWTLPRLFEAKALSFWGIQISLVSFWFLWIVSFSVSLLLLIVTIKFSGPSKEQESKWLSPQQMRFAYCYGIVNEIRKYRTNHLVRHIETAGEHLETIATSVLRERTFSLANDIYPEGYWRREIQLSEHQVATLRSLNLHGTRPYWYRLQPETDDILSALRSFLPKLRDRLRDRKDLTAIEAVITDLSGYFYAEIPDISDGTDETTLRELGMSSLIRFAQKINDLPEYRSEQQTPSTEEKVSRKVVSTGQGLNALFNHENVLISFLAWYVFLLVLFCAGFYMALRYFPSIVVDSTVITALVGGPIAGAVTAVTIPRFGKKKTRQE